ncbi:hypothetical protein ACCI36_005036 [Vibrio parahaemolyticus]
MKTYLKLMKGFDGNSTFSIYGLRGQPIALWSKKTGALSVEDFHELLQVERKKSHGLICGSLPEVNEKYLFELTQSRAMLGLLESMETKAIEFRQYEGNRQQKYTTFEYNFSHGSISTVTRRENADNIKSRFRNIIK